MQYRTIVINDQCAEFRLAESRNPFCGPCNQGIVTHSHRLPRLPSARGESGALQYRINHTEPDIKFARSPRFSPMMDFTLHSQASQPHLIINSQTVIPHTKITAPYISAQLPNTTARIFSEIHPNLRQMSEFPDTNPQNFLDNRVNFPRQNARFSSRRCTRRRIHILRVLLRPPSVHRPDRRQVRHVHVSQIGLRLAISQADGRSVMSMSLR